jgi:hypothetical protein
MPRADKADQAKIAKALERKISRLTGEISAITDFFYYHGADKDRPGRAAMLERRRDDIVRAAVLQLHTAIEDVLDELLTCRVLGVSQQEIVPTRRRKSAAALRKLLRDLGFFAKVRLARALDLISSRRNKELDVLNELRNRCSHNWLLNTPRRLGRKPADKKPPLLSYRDQNLHTVETFKAFTREYSRVYVQMWIQYLDMPGSKKARN